MSYIDQGYSRFLTRSLLQNNRSTSLESKQQFAAGSISSSSIIPPMNATTDIVFSSTDNDTAGWTSGKIYFSNGTSSRTIDAGNTGNITATTYVYFDREKDGALQTTTEVQKAAGMNKLLIAIIEEGATDKDCKITPIIAAGLTVTNITANQIAAGTITAELIDVDQLDALAVNTGTLTVDETVIVGASNLKLEGANKRILVNDGSNDMVLIGYQAGGF